MTTKTQAQTKSIAMEYDLPFPPAKVWRALTEPALLAKWLMSTDMQARVGQQFTFRMQPMPGWNGVVYCEVLEVEPEKRLRYTWKGGPESLEVDSVVTWTLTPTTSGTKLGLEHSGFSPDMPQAFNGAKYGWQKMAGQQLPQVLAELA